MKLEKGPRKTPIVVRLLWFFDPPGFRDWITLIIFLDIFF